jgi:hypothetical protein
VRGSEIRLSLYDLRFPVAIRITSLRIAAAVDGRPECRRLVWSRPRVTSLRCHVRSVTANTWPAGAGVSLDRAVRPDRPVPPMAGTAAIGAVVQLLAAAIEDGRDLSSMSGILADAAYRLLLA